MLLIEEKVDKEAGKMTEDKCTNNCSWVEPYEQRPVKVRERLELFTEHGLFSPNSLCFGFFFCKMRIIPAHY